MSVLNLDKLFKPESVALIGASRRENAIGNVVMKNLLAAGFHGPILPVNPKASTVRGVFAYPDLKSLPLVPDLAVICTPAASVPGIIDNLGAIGTRVAIVISAGFADADGNQDLKQQMLDAAKPYGLRILGPNCVGLLVSSIGLNASFAHTNALPGKLALLSQSGAMCTSILDWANSRGIGFSCFVSMGDALDIDFGDLLDYLGSDPNTQGILLYIESIREARKFLSAARATARNKKVILIKAGRFAEGARAAASHTGALMGNDDVFDTAVRRAGMLRVNGIDDLFAAVETLAHAKPVKGNRLIILTNGGGPGVLATDDLISRGGTLAELTATTINSLNAILPANWSKANPVDIIGDSDAERYVSALKILLNDPNYDAVLVMLVPSAVIDNTVVASAIVKEVEQSRKPILTCWMGEAAVDEARKIFQKAGVPTYESPAMAINAFMHLVDYEDNQRSLIQTPASIPEDFSPAREDAGDIIKNVLKEGRDLLTEPESKAVLKCYKIPTVETRIASTAAEVVKCAKELGFPVALKILSADISHKSDVGGVLLDIDSPAILEMAAEGMLSKIQRLSPEANIEGFTVQSMIHFKDGHELIIGMSSDRVFGPVILFGAGGTSVEIVNDKALALPPLNMTLADQLIKRTRISKVLMGYRDVKAAAVDDIQLCLVKISQLIADHPQIAELDINPLLANSEAVIALDARIRVEKTKAIGTERFAIRPYPRELEENVSLKDLNVIIRPIKPEDEAAHQEFIRQSSHEDLYFRFFRAVSDLSHEQLARFTQIDYDREMAFIVTRETESNKRETLGVVRAVFDADNIEAEFAIIIRSDIHRKGIGTALMKRIIDYCRSRGTLRIVGQTLSANHPMRNLATKMGFKTEAQAEVTLLNLDLQAASL